MKKIAYALFPLLLAGFVLPDDNCSPKPSPVIQLMNGEQYDGPYVSYKNDRIYIQYVLDSLGTKGIKKDSVSLSEKANLSLNVLTDIPGITFNVKLKSTLENEKTETPNVNKLFIVSDIEGNFRAFRKLLQANNVIDSNFNWTFGDGHLVLTGDFVDRGIQVTEVLWLIYSLEEKAKAAGGYIHYILGNHEIMNMSGDLRYLNPKYVQNELLMGQRHVDLLGPDAELGRWLRTKNVMEKVGDILFCHGGVSGAVNKMDITTAKISKLVRPYYADSSYKYDRTETEILYSDYGPFWYRGYYQGTVMASSNQVDSTLSLYKVKHIATGHTIVADTISVLFNGRLFNTDVHHAKGLSEGLLVENGNFYRVNSIGEKFQVAEQ